MPKSRRNKPACNALHASNVADIKNVYLQQQRHQQ